MTDFTIKSGDTAPALTATLYDGATPVNLTGATVTIRMRAIGYPLPLLDDVPAVITDPQGGKVSYQWQAGDTDEVGDYEVEWTVTFAGGGVQTFPTEGFTEVQIEPSLADPPVEALPLPDQCWPVDEGCCAEFGSYPVTVRNRAKALATQTLRMLTGYRVGGCPVTVTPRVYCSTHGWWYAARPISPFFPVANTSGAWVNNGCVCGTFERVTLPGPVGRVDEVKVAGVALTNTAYEVVNGRHLVRTDDISWPAELDTVQVTYLRGIPVDGLGAYAAGVLACEYAKACSGAKCRLPAGVTEVVRQGVAYTIATGAFPDGRTGIREVDAYLMRWNPNGLRADSTVWTPDMPTVNTTTWRV